ncbi:hypothetical protein M1D99_26785 [Pseudomonas sp. R3-41]
MEQVAAQIGTRLEGELAGEVNLTHVKGALESLLDSHAKQGFGKIPDIPDTAQRCVDLVHDLAVLLMATLEAGPGLVGGFQIPVWYLQRMVAQRHLPLKAGCDVTGGNAVLEQIVMLTARFGRRSLFGADNNGFRHTGSSLMWKTRSLASALATNVVAIYRMCDRT